MKNEYPKWLYKAGKEPLLVEDEAAHKKVRGWRESPDEAEKVNGKQLQRAKDRTATLDGD